MLALLSLGDQRRAYAEEHRSGSDHGLPVHSQADDGMEPCMKVAPCMSYDRERLPTTKNPPSTYASLIEMAPHWSLQVRNRAMCHYFLCCRRDEKRAFVSVLALRGIRILLDLCFARVSPHLVPCLAQWEASDKLP